MWQCERPGGCAMVEWVVRPHGVEAGRIAIVSTLYTELLVGGGQSCLRSNVVDIPGQALTRNECTWRFKLWEGVKMSVSAYMGSTMPFSNGLMDQSVSLWTHSGVVNIAIGEGGQQGCRRGSLVVCDARSEVFSLNLFWHRMQAWQRSWRLFKPSFLTSASARFCHARSDKRVVLRHSRGLSPMRRGMYAYGMRYARPWRSINIMSMARDVLCVVILAWRSWRNVCALWVW